ncbi:MAG: ComF family protein [Planctomycetaceae bacterium]|nr:ComF family protein [Planctomycetaceae bacterium]
MNGIEHELPDPTAADIESAETRQLAPRVVKPQTGMHRWWNQTWNFLYPPLCCQCGTDLGDQSSTLCARCEQQLEIAQGTTCHRCAAPVGPHLDTHNGCGHCRNDSFAFDRVFALGVHRDGLKRAILNAKTSHPLAAGLVELLYRQRGHELQKLNLDCVIPIPQYWLDRLLQPHFAAQSMAQAWSRLLMVDLQGHILTKRRRTQRQSVLSPSERKSNLRNAFGISGHPRLEGRTILLVDDVLTTGTTAHRAAKVLRTAGAARIYVAVIARGIGVERLSSS